MAGDQALRRSAFQEAIAHLGKAIEMADKESGGKAAGVAGQRQQLHVAYGNALFAARGPGARETTEAFARAREAAAGDKYALERLAVDYGLWAGSYLRGELSSMRAYAEDFLSDVDRSRTRPRPASRIARWASLIISPENMRKLGSIWTARSLSSNQAATTIWPFVLNRPGRRRDGLSGDRVMACREIDRAVSLVQGMQTRLAGVSH